MSASQVPSFPMSTSGWRELDRNDMAATGHRLLQSFGLHDKQWRANTTFFLPYLRAWLQETTFRGDTTLAEPWGQLLHALGGMHEKMQWSSLVEDEVALFAGYFHAMTTISTEEFSRKGARVSIVDIAKTQRYLQRPVQDSLMSALSTLSSQTPHGTRRATPLLAKLLNNKDWDPHALLGRLHQLVPQQREYALERTDCETLAFSPYYGLLTQLGCAMPCTRWRPKDSDVYRPLWSVIANHDSVESRKTYIETLLTYIPSQSQHGLSQLLESGDFEEQDVDLFFPLRWNVEEPHCLLENLVAVFAANRGEQARCVKEMQDACSQFEHLLKLYHPELSQLMHLHFGLFPESTMSDTNIEVLLFSFEGLPSYEVGLPTNFEAGA